MHREDTATLTTYLSENFKIFICLTPLDDQPIVLFNRVQDPSPSIKNNFSSDQQNRANQLNNKSNTAQQPRHNSLYSAAAKRYFATITLSPDELDSFRAFLPVIDNFYHFQLYAKKNREIENIRISSSTAMNKAKKKPMQSPKEQRIPRCRQWADKKVPQFRLKKHHQNGNYHLMRCRMR